MPDFSFSSTLPHPPDAVFAWHERPGAFERMAPPWLPIHLESQEGIRDGMKATIRLGWGPLSVNWRAVHRDYQQGISFTDVQEEGPFASWIHRHRFEPVSQGCRMTDEISYELPLGALGEWTGGSCTRSMLERQFAYRHRVLRADLDLHATYRSDQPLTVAVSGASGLIGSTLVAFLRSGGHRVLRLVRRAASKDDEIRWDPGEGVVDLDRMEGLDAIVHLAGENLFAPRWTSAKKERIYRSRVNGTSLLANAIAKLNRPPAVFVSSSAIGIYGNRGDEIIDETSATDDDTFLGRVCLDWEAAADPTRQAGVRTVHIRTGVVISGAGGALEPMLPLFKLGLGGRLAGRDTYLSWIAMDDMIGAIYHAVRTDTLDGPVNLTGPEPVTWDEFADAMGRVLNRPTFVTVPQWLTRAATGEMGENVILAGARVLPKVLTDSSYRFLFSTVDDALGHQLGRSPDVPDRT